VEIGTIDIGNAIRELWPHPQMAQAYFKYNERLLDTSFFAPTQGLYLFLDSTYWAYDAEGWRKLREGIPVDTYKYLPGVGDCDDFAIATKWKANLISWAMSNLEEWPEDQRRPPALGFSAVFHANGQPDPAQEMPPEMRPRHAILYYVQDEGHDDRFAPHVHARKVSLWGWEPQNDRIWPLRPRPHDWPYFILW